MDDLRRRFASLDRLPAPDLWDTIELRAAAHDPVARVTAVVTPLPMRSRRSTRRSLVLLAAIVALLVALVAGALAIGSRRPPLPAIVTVPSASASIPSASATPGASPSPSSSASTATTPWMTGQELTGALSATYGYRWSPIVDHDSTVTSFSSDPVSVEAPFDGPAKVRVAADTNAVAGAGCRPVGWRRRWRRTQRPGSRRRSRRALAPTGARLRPGPPLSSTRRSGEKRSW